MNAHDEMVIEIEAPGFDLKDPASTGHDFNQPQAATPPSNQQSTEDRRFAGAVIGNLVGLSASGAPLIHFAGSPVHSPLPATSACPVTVADIGRGAILLFEHGDPRRPILLGLIQGSSRQPEESPVEVRLDGEQLMLTAKNELVLRCGKASITLTRAGKVLIRGAYLLSRSSGANRIKGGSVQIN